MNFILWLIAVILVVLGIGALLRRQIIWGVVLIVFGLCMLLLARRANRARQGAG